MMLGAAGSGKETIYPLVFTTSSLNTCLLYEFSSTTGIVQQRSFGSAVSFGANGIWCVDADPLGRGFVYGGNSSSVGISSYDGVNATGSSSASTSVTSSTYVLNARYSRDGLFIATATTDASTSFRIWNVINGVTFGTQLANPPSIGSSNTSNSIAFHPTANIVAVRYGTTLSTYSYSSSGWGALQSTKTLQGIGINKEGLRWSPDGLSLAVTSSSSPFLFVYPYTVGGGLGNLFSGPPSTPTEEGEEVCFSPGIINGNSGEYALGHFPANNTHSIYRLNTSTGFTGSALTISSRSGYGGAAFTPDGKAFVRVGEWWPFSASTATFGSSNALTLQSGTGAIFGMVIMNREL